MGGHIADAGRTDWNTPKLIVETVRDVFGGIIRLDPCSNEGSIVHAASEYLLPYNDGLEDSWDYPSIFVNPPYGRCYMHIKDRFILDNVIVLDDIKSGKVPARVAGLYGQPTGNKGLQNKLKLDTQAVRKSGEYRTSTIRDWVLRAEEAYRSYGSEVVMLIPAAVDTKHWQESILETASALNLLRGRVHFDGVGPAPMACALVYWGAKANAFCAETWKLGRPVNLRNNVHFRPRMYADLCSHCDISEWSVEYAPFCSRACKVTYSPPTE